MTAAIDLAHARDALFTIDPGGTRDEWHTIGRAAIAAGLSIEDLIEWSQSADNYRGERDVRAAFRGISPNGKTGPGTLFSAAMKAGWRPPKDGEAKRAPPKPAGRPVARPVAALKHTSLSPWGLELFAAAVALPGTVGEKYLQARGCAIPPADGDLRFHPALQHPCGHTGPGLVALVTDALTRERLTLHRTWIRPDGTKAPEADPPRMLLGGHRKAGGVIRLWPDEAVTTGLAVAEGIETALSLAHAYKPAWACIDAGNLAEFPVLPGIECLVIGADHDPAGLRAAKACADRWDAAGADVAVVMARREKSDINDLEHCA